MERSRHHLDADLPQLKKNNADAVMAAGYFGDRLHNLEIRPSAGS
jgi:hypothetical protein